MPIWGQLEFLCRAVSEEGQREADTIVSRAKAEAKRIIAEAKERAEKQHEEEVLSRRGKAHLEARRKVDGAELEARRRIMAFREEVIREMLGNLEKRLERLRSEPSYGDFLLEALKEGIERLSGKDFVVEVAEGDLDLLRDRMKDLAADPSLGIAIRRSASVEGGVRVYRGDGRLLYDNSIPARLKRTESEIRQLIWREIFGSERE